MRRGIRPDNGPETDAANADEAESDDLETVKQKALSNPDPEERADAIGSLYVFDDAEVVPVLKQALTDSDSQVRMAALDQLAQLDDPPVDVVGSALKDADPEMRERAVTILGGLDSPQAADLVRSARNDPDEDVRSTAELYAEDPDNEEGE